MHGLSLYIETNKHKLLVDTGNGDLFLKNAQKLGIDISTVDTVIITHGHSDHGGGLKYFFEVNKTAKVYIQSSAFNQHYTKALGFIKINIGLDESLKIHPQVILLNGDTHIDNELFLITNPSYKELIPKFNKSLLEKHGKKFIKDNFEHEQSIIISEDKIVLIGGCAHRGIVNIITDAETKIKDKMDYCISGFHLFNPATKATESDEIIRKIANELLKKEIKYFTCHCTGTKAYETLKQYMPERIDYFATGQTIEI